MQTSKSGIVGILEESNSLAESFLRRSLRQADTFFDERNQSVKIHRLGHNMPDTGLLCCRERFVPGVRRHEDALHLNLQSYSTR